MGALSKAGSDAEARALPSSAGNPALEFAAILRRRKGTILAVFLVVTGVVAAGAATAPPTYKAESSLLVRIGREYIYRPEVGRSETARIPSLSEMVNSEIEILSSRHLAEQVVDELGVETLYPDLLELGTEPVLAAEQAVLRFRGSTYVRGVLESSIIKVSFEHTDPQVAADAVNLLVDRFKDKHLEVFGESHSSFLEDQLAKRQLELTRAEEALARFKQENGVFDLDEQRTLFLGQRVRLDEALQALQGRISEVSTRLQSVDGQAEASALATGRSPELREALVAELRDLQNELLQVENAPPDRSVEDASLRLLDLQLKERELLRNYQDSNRLVEGVRGDMQLVKSFLEDAERRVGILDQGRREGLHERIARITASIEAFDRTRLREERDALETQRQGQMVKIESLDRQVQRLDQQEKTLRQLERDLTQSEARVQTYQERVEDARITDELDREKRINVKQIEPAARPLAPTGLSRNMKIALGAVVGLLSGIAAAVFLELFRPR